MSTHSATYCPEDNKLRLYPAYRLSADEFAKVKRMGFKWAPKQGLFVAGAWSPDREDMLLEMCDGYIGDEDYSPEERAADRAERFSEYGGKRIGEAVNHADTFDAGPTVFGHQSAARAQRQADRHDRHRKHAVNQWQKAEYWQRRTAGVISNALHRSSAPVRRSRLLTLEAELRGVVARYTPPDNPPHIIEQQAYDYSTGKYKHDGAKVHHVWVGPKGRGGRWVELSALDAIKADCERWENHLRLRINYEQMMLANEGGMAAEVKIEPGGWIRADLGRYRKLIEVDGWAQIIKVNRSPATKRVTSVVCLGRDLYGYCDPEKQNKVRELVIDIQRQGENAYRAPTDEEREQFATATKERKAKAKASKPKAPPLINPTEEHAQRLQDIWNEQARKESTRCTTMSEVVRMTQAEYSARSKGSYASFETVEITEKLNRFDRRGAGRVVVFKVRKASGKGSDFYAADRVIVITDKPQTPIPWDDVAEIAESMPTVESVTETLPRLYEMQHNANLRTANQKEYDELLDNARYVGYGYRDSTSQFGLTDAGMEAYKQLKLQTT